MSDFKVASRYAKSLVGLAIEQNQLDAIKADMELVAQTLDESRDLRLLLRNPLIAGERKEIILKTIFKGKVNDVTLGFFRIVCRKGREGALHSIAHEVIREYNDRNQVQPAEVITAFQITEELRETFKAAVQKISGKKQVVLREQVSSDLIGGFVLNVGDKQIDQSVATSLRQLRARFLARN